jgi:hypothetical protein
VRRISNTNGTLSRGSGTRSRATASALRIGAATTGPGEKSTSTPIPGIGVKMSEKKITASDPIASIG